MSCFNNVKTIFELVLALNEGHKQFN